MWSEQRSSWEVRKGKTVFSGPGGKQRVATSSIPGAKNSVSGKPLEECHGWSERSESEPTLARAKSLALCLWHGQSGVSGGSGLLGAGDGFAGFFWGQCGHDLHWPGGLEVSESAAWTV